MSGSPTPTPPPSNPSGKKRKYAQLDQEPPPLPPTGSVLYIALYALPRSERGGGVLDYRWAFLLASDDKAETRGRQYFIRETSSKVQPRHNGESSKPLGVLGRRFEELAFEQQRKRFDELLATQPFAKTEDVQTLSAWEFEIQDVSMQSSTETRIRIQLPRVQDVESFEALIQDAFLESDGLRGVDWNHVMWMRDVWTALAEAGDVLGVGGLESEPVNWEKVQKTAMGFVKARESEGRFEQRFEQRHSTRSVPTWGLFEKELLVP